MQSKSFPIVAGAALAAGVLSAFSPAVAHAAPEAYGHAYAWAQGAEDDQGFGPFDEPVQSFAYDAQAVHNPQGRTPADTAARARTYGSTFGPLGVYTSIAGHASTGTEGEPVDVAAEASALADAMYRVTSSSLPNGAPVTARLTLNFDGRIETIDNSNGQLKSSELYASIFTDTQLFENGEYVDTIHEGGADFYADDRFDYGDFAGDGVFTSSAPGRHAAVFKFTDTVEFDTTVGAELVVSFNLWADAWLDFPLGASATVDFFDGTSFALAAADPASDVQFEAVVPEPAANSLLGLGALATLGRRRRR
jgi:hypothetical protein